MFGTASLPGARQSIKLSYTSWFLDINLQSVPDGFALLGTIGVGGIKPKIQAINQGGSNVGYHAISPSIGRISDQGYAIQYFQGKLDDFAIHNRILSPAEITQLYNAAPNYLWSIV